MTTTSKSEKKTITAETSKNKEEIGFFNKLKNFILKEKQEEQFKPILITDEKEIKELIQKIENRELVELRESVQHLADVINKLIIVQKESVEFIVQTATATQEIENLLDNKIIMISNDMEDIEFSTGSKKTSNSANMPDLLELRTSTDKKNKKMAN